MLLGSLYLSLFVLETRNTVALAFSLLFFKINLVLTTAYHIARASSGVSCYLRIEETSVDATMKFADSANIKLISMVRRTIDWPRSC